MSTATVRCLRYAMSPDAPAKIRLIGLIAGGYSGIPRYAALLTRSIDRVASEFPMLQITLVTGARGALEVSPRNLELIVPRGLMAQATAGPRRLLAEHVLAARGKADLLHFFDLTGPLLAPSQPFVATAHDAKVAYDFLRLRWAYKRPLYPWALKRAKAIVAVSQFAKDEIARHFGTDPARIHVVYSGPGLEPSSVGGSEAPKRARRYLLYLGALEANKNLAFLVQAFERSGSSADLLIAGRPGSSFGALQAAIDVSSARDRIHVLHGVSDLDADRLYRGALALVHPSFYEGFGFTPLEAMTRGCPVLTSDIPAIREVSGAGAMLLPLEDVDAWAQGIRRVSEDECLRAELRERGSATVSRYSWDEAARHICRLFIDLTTAPG